MATQADSMNLTHHFLIAMPGLQDASFARSVVYLCEHRPRGALALVINKPTDIKLRNQIEKLDQPLGRAPLALFAGADNLFDTAYEQSYGFPQAGRIIYLGLDVFGQR